MHVILLYVRHNSAKTVFTSIPNASTGSDGLLSGVRIMTRIFSMGPGVAYALKAEVREKTLLIMTYLFEVLFFCNPVQGIKGKSDQKPKATHFEMV